MSHENDNTRSIRILHIEDSPMDAEIIRERLADAGYTIKVDWAANEQEFTAFLQDGKYDLILADYNIPGFEAPAALLQVQTFYPDVPFICISGAIGEEKAVELLKLGATDYVSKGKLDRLTLALQRALNEVSERNKNRLAEEAKRESEKKLRQSRDLLVNLARLVPGVIYQYRLNPDGSSAFPWSSPGMNDIYEVTPEEVKEDATPVFGHLHPEDLEMVSNAIQESARTLNTFYCEFRVILPRQGLRWRGSQAQPERTEDGGTLWHGIISDITERKQMEEQTKKLESRLQQAQKMESIGTLAGGIAHDFNNILSPIVGYTEMLLEDVSEDSPFKNSLNQIYTSALRAQSLVKQILTFSRQESSELMLMKMQPIVKEALKLIRSTIPTTIDIKQDIYSDCGVIKADPTQIHQIVMNLTTNAYHAMEETGGELKVSLKEIELGEYDIITPDMTPGVYACLTVADTGVGMDKSLTDKIFDPFFTTKALGKGTGMGLSVVHGIVTAMGGAIYVYSEHGEGTRFNVYLPVEKSLSEKKITHSTAPIRGGTEHILFVDDEELILQMEKLMLERLGYQVTSRTSSLEALEAFQKKPDKFDMVITDMAMPNMSGDKLSVELTKRRPDIPELLCTGFSEKMSEEKAASLGIKGFLLKPIIMKDLAHKIREVLDKK
ncbi:MAG: response regulator [Desulfobacula sp.]|nr:response regulator [Desulfobacula sp.]